MARMIAMAAAVFAIMPSQPTFAATPPNTDITTGNGLYAICTSPEDDFRLLCLAYVMGATDVLVRLGANCRPHGVTNEQMKDVVIAGLRDDVISRHLASSALMMKYEAAAFPCKK